MDIGTYLLIAVAVLPALVLAIYIYKKDRVDKEPIGLLLLLLAFGVISCFPAMFFESIFIEKIDAMFGITDSSYIFPDTFTYFKYQGYINFVGIAFVEEGCKWLFMYFITRKNKNFNSLFDGVVYAVFVSLGFAGYENIMYVLKYGFETAVIRAITAVPGHFFNAVFMGFYYSMWNIYNKAGKIESELIKHNIISRKGELYSGNKMLALSIVVPVFTHGLYDFCCSVDIVFGNTALILLICFLYCYCFYKIKSLSKTDEKEFSVAIKLVFEKYPEAQYRLDDVANIIFNKRLIFTK